MTNTDYIERQAALMLAEMNRPKPLVVGFAGYAGAGKNTAAEALLNSSRPFVSIAIADSIKDALLAVNPNVVDETEGDFEDDWSGFSSSLLDAVAEHGWDKVHRWTQVRKMLEELGAWGRNISADFWLEQALNRIGEAVASGYSVVVTDIRHALEAESLWFLEPSACTVRVFEVRRPGVAPVSPNEREATAWLRDYDAENEEHNELIDAVIENSGTVAELQAQVLRLVDDVAPVAVAS